MIASLSMVDAALPSWFPGEGAIARCLAARQPLYRKRKPRYQIRLLRDLAALMPAGECRLLDIGTGSGLVAEVIATLFPGKSVTGVDVECRLLPNIGIPCALYDGCRLPFAAGSFDCAMFCNVLHHVRPPLRAALLREAFRVTGGGPLLIKDHLAASTLDRTRLGLLDVLGNLPSGGMVRARYLADEDWRRLLAPLACTGVALRPSAYRSGFSSFCFPNRLEICFSITQSRSSDS